MIRKAFKNNGNSDEDEQRSDQLSISKSDENICKCRIIGLILFSPFSLMSSKCQIFGKPESEFLS